MSKELSFIPLNRHAKTIGDFLFLDKARQELIEEHVMELMTASIPTACKALEDNYGTDPREFSYALFCLGAYREEAEEFQEENNVSAPIDDIGENFQ